MQLVKVYEHKKIKLNEEIKDILKIEYITYAYIKDDIAILNNPRGKQVKKISRLMPDIIDENYIYDEVNVNLIKFGDESLSEEEILYKAKKLLLNMYYEIYEKDGMLVCIKETFDDKIKEEYNRGVPNLYDQIDSLIKNVFLENTNSLELQDSNDSKNVTDYDIKGMYNRLKEIIFGQDKQLKIFLANIIKNISLSYSGLDTEIIKRLKSNILLIGPTGTGKTLMVESLANILDVPYIICDAKRYTSNGYVGEDVESILIDLYHKCNDDKKKFEHGIIFIDEFDKLCEIKDERNHVNTTDVQESILKLLDGTVVNKNIRKGITKEYLSFDTSKITFVLSGAFTKMFETEQEISEEILKKYGMLSELVGRIGSTIILNKPSRDNLKFSLVNGKYSYLKLFNTYLEMLNIDYEINDEFIDCVVDMALKMNLGYRGLEKAISTYIDEYLYDLISGDTKKLIYQIKK